MLDGLGGRLGLAAGGPRDAPARQQTLRATLDWSHRLLAERERDAFARLGVFAGGCDAAAAREVCAAGTAELEALAQQSLLQVETGRSSTLETAQPGAGRCSMLETVREYALERLAASGEEQRLRALHARHFAELAEAAEPALTTDPGGAWLGRLEQEHPNLRAALGWCARSGEVELELRLAAALVRFWAIRGHLREGRAWLGDALGRGGQPPALRAKALAGAAQLALRQGDYERLAAFAGEALALCESLGDRSGMARALDRLATAAANQGDHDGGMELYERSAALWREVGDDRGLAASATNIGCLALMQGDFGRAAAMSEEGVALYRRMGERDALLQPQFNLGVAALLDDRGGDALAIFRVGLELALALGYVEALVYFLEGHAAVRAARGEGRHAAVLAGAAEAAAERVGVSLEPFERELHERTAGDAERALGGAAFAAARDEGRRLEPEEAAGYAMRLA
jgi:non-specific serine/threonine protein kinase